MAENLCGAEGDGHVRGRVDDSLLGTNLHLASVCNPVDLEGVSRGIVHVHVSEQNVIVGVLVATVDVVHLESGVCLARRSAQAVARATHGTIPKAVKQELRRWSRPG